MNPEVGFGVVGTKTFVISSPTSDRRYFTSPFDEVTTKQIVHKPGRGYSISATSLNDCSDCCSAISKTFLKSRRGSAPPAWCREGLRPPQERPANEVPRQNPQQDEQDDGDRDPEPGDIVPPRPLGPESIGDIVLNEPVKLGQRSGDKPVDNRCRDRERGGNDDPRKEIIPQARQSTGFGQFRRAILVATSMSVRSQNALSLALRCLRRHRHTIKCPAPQPRSTHKSECFRLCGAFQNETPVPIRYARCRPRPAP